MISALKIVLLIISIILTGSRQVTQFSPGGTNFKLIQNFLQRVHKLFVCQHPSYRGRGKETPLIGKILGTIISEVEIDKILGTIIIRETTDERSRPVFTENFTICHLFIGNSTRHHIQHSRRKFSTRRNSRTVFRIREFKDQSAVYIMIPERADIIDKTLSGYIIGKTIFQTQTCFIGIRGGSTLIIFLRILPIAHINDIHIPVLIPRIRLRISHCSLQRKPLYKGNLIL